MPTRPLRLWQWETVPNGLPQRERLTHPSDQHRSNSLRRAQILCEGDSSANFKVLALPNTLWGWRLLGAIFLLSLSLAKPGSHYLFFFLFLFNFFFYFFSFFGGCNLCTTPLPHFGQWEPSSTNIWCPNLYTWWPSFGVQPREHSLTT